MHIDFSRLCIHTMTTKSWWLDQATRAYADAGVSGISVWRHHLESIDTASAAKLLRDSGLSVVSLCRGGFFPADTEDKRQAAIDDNKRAIDDAAAIGAPLVVLVCGAVPRLPLSEARKHIADGIAAILPHAESSGIKLAIEPLHPMYADSRSAINTLKQANDLVFTINDPWLGVTIDVYHVWWDPDLEREIRRAASTIFSFHVCDWRMPTRDLLDDRTLMGEGCIPIRQIRGWVEAAGFDGFIEVEIFSDDFWALDQSKYLQAIKDAYLEYC